MPAPSPSLPPSPPGHRPGTVAGVPRSVCLGVAGALAVPAVALMCLVAGGWRPLLELDAEVARTLHSVAVAHSGWTRTNRVLTDWVWDTWTMRLLLAVVVLHLVWRGERLLALWLAVTATLGALVQQGLKALLDRERPEWTDPVDSANYAAMPSGHVMTAALVCGLLLWVLRLHGAGHVWWRLAVGAAAVSVAGVAFTRVQLGVHWLTDVVVGCLLGVALAACAAAAWRGERPHGTKRS